MSSVRQGLVVGGIIGRNVSTQAEIVHSGTIFRLRPVQLEDDRTGTFRIPSFLSGGEGDCLGMTVSGKRGRNAEPGLGFEPAEAVGTPSAPWPASSEDIRGLGSRIDLPEFRLGVPGHRQCPHRRFIHAESEESVLVQEHSPPRKPQANGMAERFNGRSSACFEAAISAAHGNCPMPWPPISIPTTYIIALRAPDTACTGPHLSDELNTTILANPTPGLYLGDMQQDGYVLLVGNRSSSGSPFLGPGKTRGFTFSTASVENSVRICR